MPVPPSPWPTPRRLELTCTYSLTDLPKNARSVALWIPLPGDSARQTVRLLENRVGGRITTERTFGNRILYRPLSAAEIAAGRWEGTLRWDLTLRETVALPTGVLPEARTKPLDRRRFAPYLAANRLIPLTGPITALAASLNLPTDPLRAGRATYDYLIDRFVYNWQAPGAGKGDAVWACGSETGDCSDYHSVFIGVCRTKGIPADHCFGLPVPPEKDKVRDWHCWAQFYVDGIGWVPIDASEADKHPELREYYFGTLGTRCVALSHGRDIVLEPRQSGPPLNEFAAPYAEVDGRPRESVRWEGRYRSL
jgi:transglutaminase-like putative cysteine protease